MFGVRNILLVEDNEIDIAIIKYVLSSGERDNKLMVKKDGAEALAYLQEEYKTQNGGLPDLIILDLNIPSISGIDFLKQTKSISYLRRIPIVVLTASDIDWDVSTTYDFYANCFIKKPTNTEDMVNVIKNIEHFWCNTVQLPPNVQF